MNITEGRATYSPEDNKLRLYVGRVSREEFLALRGDGWTCTPKQRENGGCDFVATWTPSRRNTALEYGGGIIEDEDQPMAERAADRAERFGGYRDKRLTEATGHADRYDAAPAAHGFQSQARAERAAARHDRIADRAGDAWDKAEYWTSRTAGVIANALYKSRPDVRMGRIKELEADLRRHEKGGREDDWTRHYRLRLAYENQMLEAQGGRAAFIEIQAGGKIGSFLILKVNKSPATGRVTSVWLLKREKIQGYCYKGRNIPGTEWSEHQFETERMPADAYKAPTAESLAELAEVKAAMRKAAPKGEACPLINPTDEDAQRLQDIWNAQAAADWERRCATGAGYSRDRAPEPNTVLRISQAVYSAHSKGSYASAGTRGVFKGGTMIALYYGAAAKMREQFGREVCQVRQTSGGNYQAPRVIVLKDKPQKPLPAAVFPVQERISAATPEPAPVPVPQTATAVVQPELAI
jgi:hypothetical protein